MYKKQESFRSLIPIVSGKSDGIKSPKTTKAVFLTAFVVESQTILLADQPYDHFSFPVTQQ
jgi:hypothetical protein